jgi:hypothetical protein
LLPLSVRICSLAGMRVLLLAVALTCFGCKPDPSPVPPEPSRPAVEPGPDRKALLQKLEPWLTRVDEAPKRFSEKHCPDDATGNAKPELVLRVEDARFEKKILLPLSITHHLTWPDPLALEQALVRRRSTLGANVPSEIETLARARYVGVFHVLEYSPPRRIFRPNHMHPEWVAGWLGAWLAIHEAKGGALVCATHFIVKNDVSQAPLAIRMKSETTEALTEALGSALRLEAPAALGRITRVLALPDAALPTGSVAAL